jgi:hypothetical protein
MTLKKQSSESDIGLDKDNNANGSQVQMYSRTQHP